MKYLVTAAYQDELDAPQVYETTVEADDADAAAREAERQCRVDNGFTDDEPDENLLVDVFARPAPIPREEFDLDGIKAALEGDSNDAEHDALVGVADVLGVEWKSPY